MSIYKKLLDIQSELKAPKNQFNKFGGYNYRSCEDILEGVKPLLKEHNATLIINDELISIGQRFYVKATVILIDIETGEKIESTSQAREEETKKGMDGSQITGSASSYARKYALNGLFCIDDTKDSDATNTGNQTNKQSTSATQSKPKQETKKDTGTISDDDLRKRLCNMCYEIAGNDKTKVQEYISLYSEFEDKKTGETVQNKDYTKLSGKWLKGTYAKAKDDYIFNFSEEQFNEKYKKDGAA